MFCKIYLEKQSEAELLAHFLSAPIAALSINVPLFILFGY